MSGPAPGEVQQRLSRAGHPLPTVTRPLANYQPAMRLGRLVLTSGQLPVQAGQLTATGKVGVEVSVAQAREAVVQATLNGLAAIAGLVDLDEVSQVVRLVGYLNVADDFTQHPQVLDAASELLVTAFGEEGRHIRSAVGVASLPLGSPVEIELTVSLAR